MLTMQKYETAFRLFEIEKLKLKLKTFIALKGICIVRKEQH